MEKFGVVQSDAIVKTSKDDVESCTECGTTLSNIDETGGVRICPKCGSKPFEDEV